MKAKKGYRINFQFEEKVWPAIVSFQLSGAELVPREITKEVMNEVSKYRNCTVNVLARAKQIIEDWYHERGFVFSTVTHFDGMETGDDFNFKHKNPSQIFNRRSLCVYACVFMH